MALGLVLAFPASASDTLTRMVEDELLTWVLDPCYRVSVSLKRATDAAATPQRDIARGIALDNFAPAKRTAWTNTARELAAIMKDWDYHERRRYSRQQLKECIEGLPEW